MANDKSNNTNNDESQQTESAPEVSTDTNTAPISNPQPSQHSQRKGSSFGIGFIFGLALSLLLAAYPLYLAFFSKQGQEEVVSQAIIDTLQMQITLTYKELESVNRQLEMIAEAEARYQQLVEQRFDLETSRTHLLERIKTLEDGLQEAEQELGVTANKFDRITDSMRLD